MERDGFQIVFTFCCSSSLFSCWLFSLEQSLLSVLASVALEVSLTYAFSIQAPQISRFHHPRFPQPPGTFLPISDSWAWGTARISLHPRPPWQSPWGIRSSDPASERWSLGGWAGSSSLYGLREPRSCSSFFDGLWRQLHLLLQSTIWLALPQFSIGSWWRRHRLAHSSYLSSSWLSHQR